MSHKLPIGSFGSKLCRASFEGIGMRFYEILQQNTKTAIARATRRPRSSRRHRSIANSILYRLGSPNQHSTTLYNERTKTAEYRSAGHPRSSRRHRSIANSILYRLGSPNHDSTTFYHWTQKQLNTEPQGAPEALDGMIR